MIATSDNTALATMRSAANTGRSAATKRGVSGLRAARGPPRRLMMTNATIGIPMPPMTPSGSRRKILISSQVSRQRPRGIGVPRISCGWCGR
jgi:hypothetical protein